MRGGIAGAGGLSLRSGGTCGVLINPGIFKTATFLLENDEPSSTVFFVRWFLEGGSPGLNAYYAVTTRHSIQSSIASIRFNLKKGGTQDQFFARGDWYEYLPSDIAVLPLDIPLGSYDIRYIDVNHFARNDDYLLEIARGWGARPQFELPYGAGDEVFTVGLFEGHTGERLSQPLARFGHIALKPATGEQILAEVSPPDLMPIDAFLVEMATWEGQSGSPVFLYSPAASDDLFAGSEFVRRLTLEGNYLIGMIQGFYPGERPVKINGQDATLSPLQMGIGIVIPTRHITSALMQKPLEEQRERLRRDKQQNPKLRPSAAL